MLKIVKECFAFLLKVLIISGILGFISYKINPVFLDYIVVITLYVLIIIFFYYSLNYTHVKKSDNKSIYNWLDRLDGEDSFLLALFNNSKVQKDILENLEIVYKKLLIYSGHDLRKLRLLKGYFKSLNNETPFDLFVKLFITFLFGVFATNLSNGNIFKYFTKVSSHVINVSTNFQTGINTMMLIVMLLIAITFIIRDMFINKKRTKVIEEILEVCIKELESKK